MKNDFCKFAKVDYTGKLFRVKLFKDVHSLFYVVNIPFTLNKFIGFLGFLAHSEKNTLIHIVDEDIVYHFYKDFQTNTMTITRLRCNSCERRFTGINSLLEHIDPNLEFI